MAKKSITRKEIKKSKTYQTSESGGFQSKLWMDLGVFHVIISQVNEKYIIATSNIKNK